MAKDPKSKAKLPEGFEPPKGMPPPYLDANGNPRPLEHFDNDLPCDGEIEPKPGGVYEYLSQRKAQNKQKK
jgi:hypothetical protein